MAFYSNTNRRPAAFWSTEITRGQTLDERNQQGALCEGTRGGGGPSMLQSFYFLTKVLINKKGTLRLVFIISNESSIKVMLKISE